MFYFWKILTMHSHDSKNDSRSRVNHECSFIILQNAYWSNECLVNICRIYYFGGIVFWLKDITWLGEKQMEGKKFKNVLFLKNFDNALAWLKKWLKVQSESRMFIHNITKCVLVQRVSCKCLPDLLFWLNCLLVKRHYLIWGKNK